MMDKRLLAALVVAASVWNPAYALTGNTIVYDDADENSFNHNNAACGTSMVFFQGSVVHQGTKAIAVSRLDNNGIGWGGAATYSTTSDYDGLVFWINAGDTPTTVTSLGVYDSALAAHFLHLEDIYGGPLPANTWLRFDIPFSSPYFALRGYVPPPDFYQFCLINHSAGSQSTFIYVDDVTLTGADIFKDGFQNVSATQAP
jgi:hypothetical protein